MKRAALDTQEREFLELVADTIYSNPFTLKRETLLSRFPASGESAQRPGDHHYGAIAPTLAACLETLAERGITRLGDVSGADRERLRHGFLFHTYHRAVDDLDRHIEAQLAAPDAPLPAPCAHTVAAELTERGFEEAEAWRYFALFFQLRRAYYFIDRALIGPGRAMAELRRALWNSVFSEDSRIYDRYLWNRMEEFSTLLLGETGTGKGAAAAAIGRSGFIPFDPVRGRFRESFATTLLATNLSQFSAGLLESELFGHRKGAFTGAIDHHKGLLERCSPYGSLFLDEIGDVSEAVQIKLLKVLQERRFTPVGSHEEQRFSGRVIAATNHTLETLRGGGFRDDFFYRLSSQVIEIPPLRQRIAECDEELPRLVALLLERTVGAPRPELEGRLLDLIRRDIPAHYPWPGNVRELEQVIRRALLTGECRPPAGTAAGDPLARALADGEHTAQELLARYCALLHERFGTYEEVARRAGLDRRTVKKYVELGRAEGSARG